MPEASFEPDAMLLALLRHQVEFVVIGGMAATLHGSPHVTFDIDITPAPDRPNLDRLSEALSDLDARIRVAGIPEGLPFEHDGASLSRAAVWNLTTRAGDLDLSFRPAGTDGFADLRTAAVALDLVGGPTLIASLADIVRSKTAADRRKDHVTLPTLRQMLANQTEETSRADESGHRERESGGG